MTWSEKYGRFALVAGASEGLGAAFAHALAARGASLILLARRENLLSELAERLRAEHRVAVVTETCDLGRPDLGVVFRRLAREHEVGVGVYNAAFAPIGDLLEHDEAALLRVIDVNVRGPVVMARALAPAMVARARGALVLMSSLAGFQGAPRIATYAASKAFTTVLGESLSAELSPRGVDVVVTCAGAIRTPNYAASAKGEAPGTLEARVVAEAALDGLGRGPLVVPGVTNQLARFVLGRLLPRRAAVGIMARSTRDLGSKESP